MANQQLLDYVKQQLQLNVPQSEIKTTLLNTGWPEADVDEVFALSSGKVQEKTSVPIQSGNGAQPTTADITSANQTGTPAQASVSNTVPSGQPKSQPVVAKPTQPVTSETFQPQNEPVFQPKQEAFFDPTATGGVVGPLKPSHKNLIIVISLGVAGLIFAGLFVWMYMKNSDLQSQLSASGGISGGMIGGESLTEGGTPETLKNQIEVLSQEKSNLQSQQNESNKRINTLKLELSFLVAPDPKAPTSTTLGQTFLISGTLSEKNATYYLTTEDRVILSLKNSKDKNIIAVLKPVLGKTVEISGTYNVGSSIVTLSSLDGKTPAEILAEKAAAEAAAKAKAEAEAKAKADAEAAIASSTPSSTPVVPPPPPVPPVAPTTTPPVAPPAATTGTPPVVPPSVAPTSTPSSTAT
ncbi:MAG TPA: hypothetical protein VJL32_00005, partial [Candidatus Paceibacterota bacterium]